MVRELWQPNSFPESSRSPLSLVCFARVTSEKGSCARTRTGKQEGATQRMTPQEGVGEKGGFSPCRKGVEAKEDRQKSDRKGQKRSQNKKVTYPLLRPPSAAQ